MDLPDFDPDQYTPSKKWGSVMDMFIRKSIRMTSKEEEDSVFLAFTGRRRTGKSVNSLYTAKRCCPDFTVDDICFTIDDLIANLKEDMPGYPVIWEEASVTASNRRFMSKVNLAIIKYFQVFGWKRRIVIANLQHLGFFDNQARMQIDVKFECSSRRWTDEGGEHSIKVLRPYKAWWNNDDATCKFYGWMIPGKRRDVEIGDVFVPDYKDLFAEAGISRKFYNDYLKKKADFFEDMDGEDKADTVDKATQHKLDALRALARNLNNQKVPRQQIAEMMEISPSTLQSWNLFPKDPIKQKIAEQTPQVPERKSSNKSKPYYSTKGKVSRNK